MNRRTSKSLENLQNSYLDSDAPIPQGPQHLIGDGDFRAIGAEFLGHLVNIGGLQRNDSVLDIGCGFGRIALPLTTYLSRKARYLGFDIVREPIEWCQQNISPLHPGFAFEFIDYTHPLYNLEGREAIDQSFLQRLEGLEAASPDFVAAISLFTHLEQVTAERFMADIGTLLPTDGTLFMTCFLTGAGTPALWEDCVFPPHLWRHLGPLTALMGEPLTAAVGMSMDWLQQLIPDCGMLVEHVTFGRWRHGGAGPGPFQDILVCKRL